jgi:hypothetical protein
MKIAQKNDEWTVEPVLPERSPRVEGAALLLLRRLIDLEAERVAVESAPERSIS